VLRIAADQLGGDLLFVNLAATIVVDEASAQSLIGTRIIVAHLEVQSESCLNNVHGQCEADYNKGGGKKLQAHSRFSVSIGERLEADVLDDMTGGGVAQVAEGTKTA
jgi:hypothetical protein